jgi:hypothetical protein
MKILLVDTFSTPHARGNVEGLRKAYEKVGTVSTYAYRAWAQELRGVGFMNRHLIDLASEMKPDLVHLGKCEMIRGDTVRAIKERCPDTKVVHFYSDMRLKVPAFVAWIGKFADLTLVPAEDDTYYQMLHDAGIKNVKPWYIGTDPEIFRPFDVPKDQSVAFMANHHRGFPYTNARKRLIKDIGAAGIDIHVYGAGWPTPPLENVTLHGYVGEEDFARACSRSKIVLGYSNFNVRMYTSWRRVVNTMSSGAFYLTDYFGGIETVFEKEFHLDWFRGIPDAIDSVKFYMEIDSLREEIADQGYLQVLGRHTWDNRVAKMMEYVEGLDES